MIGYRSRKEKMQKSNRTVERNPRFGQKIVQKIFDDFETVPKFCNLIAAYKDEEENEWLYVARENKIKVLKCEMGPSFKPTGLDHDFPFIIHRIDISCDFKYLSVTFDEPLVNIYQGGSLLTENLELLHKIAFTTSPQEALARDLIWHWKNSDEFCTLSSDNTVGLFSLKTMDFKMKKFHDMIILCINWCYDNKLVVGCESGNIVILNRNLTISNIIEAQDSSMGEVNSISWLGSMRFGASYYNPKDHYKRVFEIDSNYSENGFPNFYEIGMFNTVPQNKSEHPKHHIISIGEDNQIINVFGVHDNDGDSSQMINPVGQIIRDVPFALAFHSDEKTTQLKQFQIVHVLDTEGQLISRELKHPDPVYQKYSDKQGDEKNRTTKHCKDWRKKNTTGAAVERQQKMRNDFDSNGKRKNHGNITEQSRNWREKVNGQAAVESRQNMKKNSGSNGERKNRKRSTERCGNWRMNRRPIESKLKCSPLETIDLYDPVGEMIDPFDLGF